MSYSIYTYSIFAASKYIMQCYIQHFTNLSLMILGTRVVFLATQRATSRAVEVTETAAATEMAAIKMAPFKMAATKTGAIKMAATKMRTIRLVARTLFWEATTSPFQAVL